HRLTQEPHAQVTISTAHKAKGREWPTVRIADDFHPPRGTDTTDPSGNSTPGPVNNAEARLAYVAVTRSRTQLDIGGLGWIHGHPDGQPR
ncbi:3'-5' exonuclease, partial [Streptomyces violascens]|uniref:3'-5' exonuclease n=1 Tax=Streptomyces violascens TaxID=67381 RepID=UPI0036C76139